MKRILSLFFALSLLLLALSSCNNNQTSDLPITIKPITTESTQTISTETTETPEPISEVTPAGDEFWAVTDTYSVRLLRYKSTDTNACTIMQYVVKGDTITFPDLYVDSKGTPFPVVWIGMSTGVLKGDFDLVKTLEFSNQTKAIKTNAFSFCTSIETVKLNEGLESIEKMAFWCCSSLKNLTLPSTLLSIGESAFIGTAIETLVIPSSVKEIGSKAFASCMNLTSVTLPRAFESQVADIFGSHASAISFTFVD